MLISAFCWFLNFVMKNVIRIVSSVAVSLKSVHVGLCYVLQSYCISCHYMLWLVCAVFIF